MKKLFLTLIAIAAILAVSPRLAQAGSPFSINVSTYQVTGEVPVADISGTIDISNITFSNSGATAQTVIMYELGNSSSTINEILRFVLPAAAGFYRPFATLNYNDRIHVKDLGIRKSSTSTSVYATGIYQ